MGAMVFRESKSYLGHGFLRIWSSWELHVSTDVQFVVSMVLETLNITGTMGSNTVNGSLFLRL